MTPHQEYKVKRIHVGREQLDRVSGQVLGASIAVHSALGPGLLESAYEACLVYELQRRGVTVERQKALPLRYKGLDVADAGYRVDLLVEDEVIVEVKAVDEVHPVHRAQLLTYLRLSRRRLGLLLNFNVTRLKDGGIQRLVNDIPEHPA